MKQVTYQGVTLTVNMDEKVWDKLPKVAQDSILGQLFQNEQDKAALKAKSIKALTFKVSDKKGVSVYGLGRFPVSLYANQWTRLLDQKEAILAFIEEHKASLSFEKETVQASSQTTKV